MIEWLKNSNLYFTITVNPFLWNWKPSYHFSNKKHAANGCYFFFSFRWLFLDFCIYIDNERDW